MLADALDFWSVFIVTKKKSALHTLLPKMKLPGSFVELSIQRGICNHKQF